MIKNKIKAILTYYGVPRGDRKIATDQIFLLLQEAEYIEHDGKQYLKQ